MKIDYSKPPLKPTEDQIDEFKREWNRLKFDYYECSVECQERVELICDYIHEGLWSDVYRECCDIGADDCAWLLK